MGASTFQQIGYGVTSLEAFKQGKETAEYDYGHRGYTGSMAEKDSFVEIDLPEGMNPEEYAELLVSKSDERIDDKWGDAGCLKVKDGEYLFFGWASS